MDIAKPYDKKSMYKNHLYLYNLELVQLQIAIKKLYVLLKNK